jgi:8-amino-7-oxononanoate synthase
MDGDEAPLEDIADLCRRFGAGLVVDEAHAIGVLNGGRGAIFDGRFDDVLIARIYTYGKAMAVHGAAVVGSRALIYYLVNFCRPFIYTTAPPIHQLMAINAAYDLLVSDEEAIKKLEKNIAHFNKRIKELQIPNFIASKSAIHSWVWGNDDEIKVVAKELQANGFKTKAILSPTVKMNHERLRFCLHSYNTTLDMELVLTALQAAWPKS